MPSRMTLAEVNASIDREGGDLWKWVGYIRLDPAWVPDEIAPLITQANDMVDRLHAVLGRIAEGCGYETKEDN